MNLKSLFITTFAMTGLMSFSVFADPVVVN
ncbi:hypothetical protein VIMY103929_17075 [Vibrio mytili]